MTVNSLIGDGMRETVSWRDLPPYTLPLLLHLLLMRKNMSAHDLISRHQYHAIWRYSIFKFINIQIKYNNYNSNEKRLE